jgi:UDPglucose 6-dehydrogenase/GDP-mannose 6-dehydrogenase
VSIIGAGYVGLVTGLCLADRGHRVACVDIDEQRIAALNRGVLPIHEAGLDILLSRHLGQSFFPTADIEAAVIDSELTIIAVGTPVRSGQIDLSYVGAAAASVGAALARKTDYHVVVVKSTVVPGTTDAFVRPIVETRSGKTSGSDFGVGMNPEFLREGEAVEDFQNPDRIVLGADDPLCLEAMKRLYAEFRGTQQICTNTRTAEMIKYASNALLATMISFSNEIGNLCGAAEGVDVVDVLNAVHLDKRISPVAADGSRTIPTITSYLRAGCGFGGSCFPKDVRALIQWSSDRKRTSRVLDAVLETNERQPQEVIALIEKHFPNLEKVRVSVLGLAFKPGTDDVRESPALRVLPALVSRGALVTAYDPIATEQADRALPSVNIDYAESLENALEHADAVILLTSWPEFQRVPELVQLRQTPPVIIDGRRVLDKTRVPRYEGIGLSRESGVRRPTTQGSGAASPSIAGVAR